VKAVIRSRLLADITSGKSSGLGRECELLGKDKDVDMFVRNADVQVGIFANLLEPRTGEMIENLAATLQPEKKVLNEVSDGVLPVMRRDD
jgi:hypothetical protein